MEESEVFYNSSRRIHSGYTCSFDDEPTIKIPIIKHPDLRGKTRNEIGIFIKQTYLDILNLNLPVKKVKFTKNGGSITFRTDRFDRADLIQKFIEIKKTGIELDHRYLD